MIVGWKIFNAKTWKEEKKSKCIFGVLKKNEVKRNVLETRERRMLVIFCCLSNKDGKKVERERERRTGENEHAGLFSFFFSFFGVKSFEKSFFFFYPHFH